MKAKSAFNNKLFALNVVISIPVPDNTAKADIQTTQGMLQPQQLACLQHEAQQLLFGIQKCAFFKCKSTLRNAWGLSGISDLGRYLSLSASDELHLQHGCCECIDRWLAIMRVNSEDDVSLSWRTSAVNSSLLTI